MVDSVLQTQVEDEREEAFDTSEPEQVNKARKRAARTRADRLKFVQAAMQHPQGRAWYYDLIVRCHIFNNPFMRDDPYATAFRCGEHNIGLMILDDIQTAAPEQYMQMIKENNKNAG